MELRLAIERGRGREMKTEIQKGKIKVYMVCDYTDDRAAEISGCPNIGVEFMGNCAGRILWEDGTVIGAHYSSSFGWLRNDLKNKLDNPSKYEIIDLIGQPLPDIFVKAQVVSP